jgi:hypothetical protein
MNLQNLRILPIRIPIRQYEAFRFMRMAQPLHEQADDVALTHGKLA